jgi:hypothetical protein
LIRLSLVALSSIVVLSASGARAEGWELTGVAGLMVGGSFSNVLQNEGGTPVERDPGLDNGFLWGINAGKAVHENVVIEAIFRQQVTQFSYTDTTGVRLKDDTKVYTFHGGGLFQSGRSYDRVRGYGGISLGATAIDPSSGSAESRFSFGFSGGAKIRTHTKSLFRLQAAFYSTYINSNDRLFCDFTCYTTSAKNFVNQWEFSGGFTLLL